MAQSSEEFQQEFQVGLIDNYVAYSVLCLVCYEYAITLDQEIATAWKRKFTVSSVLLFTTRWNMLLGPFLNIIPSSQKWCIPGYALNTLGYFMSTVLVSSFSALRMYALWQGSQAKYVYLAIVLILGIVPIGTNIFLWTRIVLSYLDAPPIFSCSGTANISPKLNTEMLYITRCSLIAADIIVLVLTWIKSFKQFTQMRQLNLGLSISGVLLRDGTLYFLALLAMNILQLLTYSESDLSASNYATVVTQFMPPLLVQRFILNLCHANSSANESYSNARTLSRFSISFRVPSDFLGDIGEPLGHGQSTRAEDDDHDNGRVADEPRDGLEEGSAHPLPGISPAYRVDKMGLGTALMLQSAERANEGDITEAPADSHEMVSGPSTSAH